MAWTDGPTEVQLGALSNLTRWTLLNEPQTAALSWAKKRFNRKEMSTELSRIRDLYVEHKLDKVSCFDSSLWDGFEYKDKYKHEAEEARREMLRKFKG